MDTFDLEVAPDLVEHFQSLIHFGANNQVLESAQAFIDVEHINSKTKEKYYCSHMDTLLFQFGKKNQDPFLKNPTKSGRGYKRMVIASEIYPTGGHTRVIESFLEGEDGLILTDYRGSIGFKKNLSILGAVHAIKKKGIQVFVPTGKTPFEKYAACVKAVELCQPCHVVFFGHPDDVVSTSLMAINEKYRTSFYHHVDHSFSLGVTIDTRHFDITPHVYKRCSRFHQRNELKTIKVPDKGIIQTKFRDKINSTASIGSWAKFSNSYPEMVVQLLKKTNCKHHHVGDIPGDVKKRLLGDLALNGLEINRFEHVERVSSVWHYLIVNQIDMVISSFPYGGGLTNLEVLGAGIPILFKKETSDVAIINSGYWLAPVGTPTWGDFDDLATEINNLSRNTLELLGRKNRMHFENYFQSRIGDLD